MIRGLRSLGLWGVLALGLLVSPELLAVPSVIAYAAAENGQSGLAVGFDARGALRAASCATNDCSIDRGLEIPFPAELRPAIAGAQLSIVGIGAGHRAIVVALNEPSTGRSFRAVISAPLGAGEPKVLFSGLTGFVEGEEGTRRGKLVEISAPDEQGARRIVVGEIAEDLSLCGRPAVLEPQLLLNTDLKLHPAKVQRLSIEERERARHVLALRADRGQAAPPLGILRAIAATSAIGNPGALTDGDPESTWAEGRSGAGRGEFVLFRAPPELPISGLDLLVRPAREKPEDGVAPREFWLASNGDLVLVTMPEDAWKFPGAHYRVPLDPPLRGDCLALVSDSAYGETARARVTFAEIGAHTEFDSSSVPELVAALAGGGERAQAAGAMLRVLGQPAFEATARAFESLDEGGRRVALELLDQAPCDSSLPSYLAALTGISQAQSIHARDHIRRCGKAAAPFLAAAARLARGPKQVDLLGELLLSDPAECVDVIIGLLDVDSRPRRAALRVALSRASSSVAAKPRLLAALSDRTLSERALVEVLRSLADRINDFQPAAGLAAARLSTPSESFRTRFLLLQPSAELAHRDPALRAAFAHVLVADPDPRVRVQALAVLDNPADFAAEVLQAVNDQDVRVREAAVRAARALPEALPILAERLANDPWPLVRIAAADAISASNAPQSVGVALSRAIEDESPQVRAHVLLALGAHHVRFELAKIRARLSDEDEHPLVRAAAAEALSALCDFASLPTLTGYALKLADPAADANQHMIGAASLLALGVLQPADLSARLLPLRAKGSPLQSRKAAESVLQRSAAQCGTAPGPKIPAKVGAPPG